MTVSDFRDLTAATFDAVSSFKGCTVKEKDAELCRVQRWVRELSDCKWPSRLSARDRQRGLLAMTKASECDV